MAQTRSISRSSAGPSGRIGAGAHVRGRIHGDGDLTVEGHVAGDVVLQGALTISEGGSVEANAVEAESLTVAGSLDGDVHVSGHVRALAGARVRGNVRGAAIAIDDGAQFAGRIDCEFSLPAELENVSAPSARRSPPVARRGHD